MPLSPTIVSRLSKAAFDNGFDRELVSGPERLVYASTHCPLTVSIGALPDGKLAIGVSHRNVADALDGYDPVPTNLLPEDAVAGRVATDIPAVHRLLRRAFQLSRSLPNQLLNSFQARTTGLPKSTEVERLVVQRIGQDIFRDGLFEFWDGRCAVSGLSVPDLLRASHIKPWAACDTDAERLDVYNGLLLKPDLDQLFDRGFITFEPSGLLVCSPSLSPEAAQIFGLSTPSQSRMPLLGHAKFLEWHRTHVFKKAKSPVG